MIKLLHIVSLVFKPFPLRTCMPGSIGESLRTRCLARERAYSASNFLSVANVFGILCEADQGIW